MFASPQTKISIRGQAILVMAVILLWCGSIFGVYCKEVGGTEAFWGALMVLLPFLITILMVILFLSYRRSDGAYQRWFWPALVAAGSCWVLIGGALAVVLVLMMSGH